MNPRFFIGILTCLISVCRLAAEPSSFAYILQADAFAETKAEAVSKLSECGRDWIVLDASFDSDTAWNQADLRTMRANHPERKVLAYISIGEAEDYRSYWQEKWKGSAKPSWLLEENPAWKGNYRVAYWHPEWQSIILSVVDIAMEAGFDGIYLDIVDGFEGFEKDGARFIDDRLNPATKQSFRRDMVEWVKRVAERARSRNTSALVIPQNGSQLLAHADFVKMISGIGIEDLFTEGDRRQPDSHSEYVLEFLKALQETSKPVLVIEYPRREKSSTLAKDSNHRHGFTWLITDRELKTLGISGH